MGYLVVYLVICIGIPALSIASEANNTECVRQQNVTNAAEVVNTCFKDLVQNQIQNSTTASTCTNFKDFTTKIDTFYNVSLATCYNGTDQKKYAPAKQILLDMFALIFKNNKLAELSANSGFSCINDTKSRNNITKCIDFLYFKSNDTSNSYQWHRRASLNFGNKDCGNRAHGMKKCTNKVLVKARCQQPLIDLTSSLFDVVIQHCNHTTGTGKKTVKGASTRAIGFSGMALLFTGLISYVVSWSLM